MTAARRILFGGLILAVLGFAANAQTRDRAAPIVGAYGAAEPLDDEAKAVFQQAVGAEPADIHYEPLTVARQGVAGMNFRFTADERTPGGVTRVRIFVFKPWSGAPRVTKIEPLP